MNKKVLGASMIGATLLSLLFSSNFGNTKAASNCINITNDKLKYVNVSMIDFDAESYNAAIRGMDPGTYYSKTMPERRAIDAKALLFGDTDGLCVGGTVNGFNNSNTGYRECDGVQQGLVKSTLSNGNLVVNDKYLNGTSLFNTSTAQGKGAVEILENWKFPFLKENNGYYSYNSENYHVKKDYNSKKFELHSGREGGFYPFNNCGESTKNVYFTAKFEIPFYMTEDGKVYNETTKKYEDMIFNFSGDDDVWVFVDNKLVVDLGGVHIKQTGNINFATNTVHYSSIYNEATESDSYNINKKAFSNGKLSAGMHTMKVFYMERAGGVSNLFVNFNMQESGVKTKHIEKYTNKVLDTVSDTGEIGTKITTKEKQFENHKLVQKPENETITLKEKEQVVNYYYNRMYTATVKYVDEISGEEISPRTIRQIYEDENYSFSPIEIPKYKFIRASDNSKGKMPHNDITITMYYRYNNAVVNARYIDKKNKNVMKTDKKVGTEGEKVNFNELKFDNYVLVDKPKEEELLFTKKDHFVDYYYLKNGKLTVNYIDKISNEKLDTKEYSGIEDSSVKIDILQFKNYVLYKEPEKTEYIFNRNGETVNIYYIHKSKVVVNYIDKDLNEELDTIEDVVSEGTTYTTKAKEFEFYKLVEKPEKEKYTIGKNDIEINYYYQKLKFNLKIEMDLKSATVNELFYNLKGKIGKLETEIRDANSESKAKIHYKIKVTNDQERAGSGTIIETLPEGYSAFAEDNPEWIINNNEVKYNVGVLEPGKSKEIDIVLTKDNKNDICGQVINRVKVVSDKLTETTLDDNEDANVLVITPRTGNEKTIIYGIICALLLGFFALIKTSKRKLAKRQK